MENLDLKLNRAFQMLGYKLRQLSWQGLLGIALLVSSLLAYLIISNPKIQQLAQLQSKYSALKANSKSNFKNDNSEKYFDITQRFYAFLPKQNDANREISRILGEANSAGLVTDKVEYSQSNLSSSLVQYQIKLPLSGSYMQIRQFLKQVLKTLPAIALSDISLSRNDVTSDLLDARIQLTLYLSNERK